MNMGGNRYVGVFQAGYTKVFTDWQVDVIVDTTVYGDSDESGPKKVDLNRTTLTAWNLG